MFLGVHRSGGCKILWITKCPKLFSWNELILCYLNFISNFKTLQWTSCLIMNVKSILPRLEERCPLPPVLFNTVVEVLARAIIIKKKSGVPGGHLTLGFGSKSHALKAVRSKPHRALCGAWSLLKILSLSLCPSPTCPSAGSLSEKKRRRRRTGRRGKKARERRRRERRNRRSGGGGGVEEGKGEIEHTRITKEEIKTVLAHSWQY